MKRNNIFMWAYITFVFFSVVMRVFLDFSLWNNIILSITISSIFFAIEDVFDLLYNTLKSFCELTDKFVDQSKLKKEEILVFFDKVDKKSNDYKNTKYDLTELQSITQSVRNTTTSIIEIIDELEKCNLSDKKKIEIFNGLAKIFAFLGFLCLFSLLINFSSFRFSPLTQEIITVVSFAIILVTQQLKPIFLNKMEKAKVRNDNLLQKIIEDTNDWHNVEKNFDEVMGKIDKKVVIKEKK